MSIQSFWQLLTVFMFIPQGMPTHNAKGEEMTKSQLKKLQKQYDAQAKKYQQYLKEQGNA